jgi:exoribonuclease-2
MTGYIRAMSYKHFLGRSDLSLIAGQAMIERGLEPEFSRAVLQELRAIAHAGQDIDPRVVDMTAWLWCSIDNDDSRDLDQLTVAQKQADGQTKIWVAVADVDVLVPKGSALDAHAKHNTTSCTPRRAFFPCCQIVCVPISPRSTRTKKVWLWWWKWSSIQMLR